MEKFKLSKCLNCDTVLFDENPQTNANEHTLINGKTKLGDEVKDMVKDDEGFWVCPLCKTDGYFSDI